MNRSPWPHLCNPNGGLTMNSSRELADAADAGDLLAECRCSLRMQAAELLESRSDFCRSCSEHGVLHQGCHRSDDTRWGSQ